MSEERCWHYNPTGNSCNLTDGFCVAVLPLNPGVSVVDYIDKIARSCPMYNVPCEDSWKEEIRNIHKIRKENEK